MLSKQLLKDYLTFTRKDRLFALTVVVVIGASLIVPRLWAPGSLSFPVSADSTLAIALDTLQHRQARRPVYARNEYQNTHRFERSVTDGFTAGELFAFDPNTTSTADWQRLGLNARTSRTITNYVSKGGRFYKPEDLQKIWGMPDGFYERVKNYVRIVAVRREYTAPSNHSPSFREERRPALISVNSTDTTTLIALPGIGAKLAARIINFREKLGGFYSVEQVGETYGLPDSTFQKIRGRLQVDGNAIRKINVNVATKDILKLHPYIRWNLANAIVEYRNQHGDFKHLDELKNIVLIDEAIFTKLLPYLTLQ